MGPLTLPNFLVVGAAKAGTTSLCAYLSKSPQVFVCDPKEPHFFVSEKPLGVTVRTFEEYLELFSKAESFAARGEGSIGYLYYSDEVIPRVLSLLGPVKIIVMLRNPVDRAYSMYWHNVRDVRESLSFEDALLAEDERVRRMWELSYHYTRMGFVADGILKYQSAFGKDNVAVLLLDDMQANRASFLSHVFGFLGVESPDELGRGVHNASGAPRWPLLNRTMNESRLLHILGGMFPRSVRRSVYLRLKDLNLRPYSKMCSETRCRLQSLYSQEIEKLGQICHRDLSGWLD